MSHIRIIAALFALSGAVCAQEEASFGATARRAPAMQDEPGTPEAVLPRKADAGTPVVAARSNAFRPLVVLPSADGPVVALPFQTDVPLAIPAEPYRAPERAVLPSALAPKRARAPRGADLDFRAEAPAPVGDPLEYYTI